MKLTVAYCAPQRVGMTLATQNATISTGSNIGDGRNNPCRCRLGSSRMSHQEMAQKLAEKSCSPLSNVQELKGLPKASRHPRLISF